MMFSHRSSHSFKVAPVCFRPDQAWFRGFLWLVLFFCSSMLHAAIRPAVLFNAGALNDGAFNQSVMEGVQRFQERRGIPVRVEVVPDREGYSAKLESLALEGFDPVVVPGFHVADDVAGVASKYPGTTFIALDYTLPAENVKSVLFREQEGSFLAGFLAAKVSPSNKFGFIGAVDTPVTAKFLHGFEAGLKKVNPNAELMAAYITHRMTEEDRSRISPWENKEAARGVARDMIAQGVDILFVAAGAASVAVIDEAASSGKLVIGADRNQDGVRPGKVLTSVVKRLDQAVYVALLAFQKGRWVDQVKQLGVAQGAVDITIDQYNNELIPQPFRYDLIAMRQRFQSGELVVETSGEVTRFDFDEQRSQVPQTLVLGMTDQFRFPFTTTEGDTISETRPGMIAEMMAMLNRDLSVTVKLVRKPYSDLIADVENGAINGVAMFPYDFHHDSIAQFPMRDGVIDVSKRMFTERWALFERKGANTAWRGGLSPELGRVLVPTGGTLVREMQQSGVSVEEAGSLKSCFLQMLKSGKPVLVAAPDLHARRVLNEQLSEQSRHIVMLQPYLKDIHYYLAFSNQFYEKYPQFSQRAWNYISQLRESPELWEASDKYLEEDEPAIMDE